jgi:hypothetical protein
MTSPENAPFSHSEARRDWRAWARGSESLASVFSNTKAASRFNALKHGLDAASILLPGEDPDAYARMVADYTAQFQPASPLQEAHLATIIHSDGLRRRLRRTQGKLYRALVAEGADPYDLDIAVLRDSPTAKLLRRVTAELAALERSYFRALNDLRLIHRANSQAEDARIDMLLAMPLPGELASFPVPPAPPVQIDRDSNPALRL